MKMKFIWILRAALLMCVYKILGAATMPSQSKYLLDEAEELLSAGNFLHAISKYQKVLEMDPKNIFALEGAAMCSANMGNHLAAGKTFLQAAEISPREEFFFNGGRAFMQAGDADAAKSMWERCLQVNGNLRRHCHIKLASLYRNLENYEEVQRHLHEAIELEPTHPEAYTYLADTYNNLKQFQLAIETYQSALKLSPRDASLWVSLGDAYTNKKEVSRAKKAYQKARRFASRGSKEALTALIGYYFNAQDSGDWLGWEVDTHHLLTLALMNVYYNEMGQAPPSALSPYHTLFFDSDPALSYRIARGWANGLTQDVVPMAPPIKRTVKQKLIVGYISRRFEDYPGTQMMLQIFGSHNRSRVTVRSFASGRDDGSAFRRAVANGSDSFVDTHDSSSKASAEMIRNSEIDILVDYDGLHDYNNMKVLGQRPAPLQVTWLGFAGSVGQSFRRSRRKDGVNATGSLPAAIDYILADSFILPPDSRHSKYFGEGFVYLPSTYQPQDEVKSELLEEASFREWRQQWAQSYKNIYKDSGFLNLYNVLSVERQRLLRHFSEFSGNDEEEERARSITKGRWLVCFNRQAKVTPDAFEDWMKILLQVPDSILILMAESKLATQNIQRQSQYWGVDSRRLLFAPRLSLPEYFRLLAACDLFLDTRYYGSHTVASDAMWVGLPVLTLPGGSFASRVAGSLNSAVGNIVANQLILSSRKDFVEHAVRLLSGTYTMRQLSLRIIESIGVTLFNSSAFSTGLERAYFGLAELKQIATTSAFHLAVPSVTAS